MQNITSRFLTLNAQDFLKGLIVASASAVFTTLAESFQKGQFTINITVMWHTAAAAGLAYLSKNLFTAAKAISPAYDENK